MVQNQDNMKIRYELWSKLFLDVNATVHATVHYSLIYLIKDKS